MSAPEEATRLLSVIASTLDDDAAPSGGLAKKACHSRSHFHRLFRALISETPGAMRRRFLLERAAYALSRTSRSVTDIALDAGYGSLEAFTRAFHKGFRVSPSIYRRMGATHFHLPAPNGFHFCAPAPHPKGTSSMDLFDRFAGTDSFHTLRLLKHAAALTPEQLNSPIPGAIKLLPWEGPDQSLRELLERLVFTKEIWNAAMSGGTLPSQDQPGTLLDRYEKADAEFQRILGEVRNRGGWDDKFVDALCDPPEEFSFGSTFAHIITFNTYRRLSALDAMRRLGVQIEGFGCPSEFEASVAAVAT